MCMRSEGGMMLSTKGLEQGRKRTGFLSFHTGRLSILRRESEVRIRLLLKRERTLKWQGLLLLMRLREGLEHVGSLFFLVVDFWGLRKGRLLASVHECVYFFFSWSGKTVSFTGESLHFLHSDAFHDWLHATVTLGQMPCFFMGNACCLFCKFKQMMLSNA